MSITMRERPIFRPLPHVLCLIAGAALCGCRAERSGVRDVEFDSTQGYRVAATVYTPQAARPAGLILMHMAGSTREAWLPFAEAARAQGYLSIAIDLRGHGGTKPSRGAAAPWGSFAPEDWLGILDDLARAKQALLEAGADPERLAIVGASLGANLALQYAASDPQIQAVVLLSPGDEYRGVTLRPAMEKYRSRPLLIMAARDDGYSAKSALGLDEMAKQLCELRLYPGGGHGTDLLAAQPLAGDQILLWLDQVLGRATPPTR